MIIDAHNHPDWYGHDLRRFLANMAEHNIDVTWVLTWECPPNEFHPDYINFIPPGTDTAEGPIPFRRCLSYVERAPEKFVLGYAPDPRRPDAIDRLAAAVDIFGVRVYGELKVRMMFDNPDALRMYRFCGEKGLPVVVHIDYESESSERCPWRTWWYGGGIEPFERAVRACPDTVFLGHGPGFWSHISGDDKCDKSGYPEGPVVPGGKIVEMLRSYPNLYGDLSAGSGLNAISRDQEFGKDFLLEFQDRLLYARDYFDNKHQEYLNSVGIPEEALEKVYSANALKLVPLGRETV